MLNKELLIHRDSTIKKALKMLDRTAEKVLIIVDDCNKLLGTISDGDLRRGILQEFTLDSNIDGIYNKNPIVVKSGKFTNEIVKQLLIENKIELIPVIDSNNIVVDTITWVQVFSDSKRSPLSGEKIDIPVVIMAGGKGTRLAPFTNVLPKPLIPLGEKTISEIIIDEFWKYGVKHFYFTLNYKGQMIEAYFNSLKKDYCTSFVWETDFYGTAGSLKLLEESIDNTIIVSNCDVIVKADYSKVFSFHKENSSTLTVLSSIQHQKIPYGVVEYKNGGEVSHIKEKPELSFTINTGVYFIEKSALDYIPPDTFFHMTDLIDILIKDGKKVMMYPINENDYIDIGQWEEYQEAMKKISRLQ